MASTTALIVGNVITLAAGGFGGYMGAMRTGKVKVAEAERDGRQADAERAKAEAAKAEADAEKARVEAEAQATRQEAAARVAEHQAEAERQRMAAEDARVRLRDQAHTDLLKGHHGRWVAYSSGLHGPARMTAAGAFEDAYARVMIYGTEDTREAATRLDAVWQKGENSPLPEGWDRDVERARDRFVRSLNGNPDAGVRITRAGPPPGPSVIPS